MTATEVMSRGLCTVEAGVEFYEAEAVMAEHSSCRLPVCTDVELVEIGTADDLTELLADQSQQLADVIWAQRPVY